VAFTVSVEKPLDAFGFLAVAFFAALKLNSLLARPALPNGTL
jgi:hypothetical protein